MAAPREDGAVSGDPDPLAEHLSTLQRLIFGEHQEEWRRVIGDGRLFWTPIPPDGLIHFAAFGDPQPVEEFLRRIAPDAPVTVSHTDGRPQFR